MIPPLVNSLWFRLLLGFAVPLVLFLGAACVSFFSIQRLLDSLRHEQTSQKILTQVSEAKENLEAMAAAKRAHHLLVKDEFLRTFAERREAFRADVADVRQLLAHDPAQLERLDRISALELEWYQISMDSFRLAKKNKPGPGPGPFQLNLQQDIDLLKQIREQTDALVAAEKDQLEKHRRDVQVRTTESVWAILAALIVSVGFSVVITQMLWRGISRPIQHLRDAVNAMRQGRYEVVTAYGPTEVAELMRGFNLMGLALTERTTLLQSSELRYRTVVGTTSNLIWTTDAAGRNNEMANWCALTGQAADEAAGDGWLAAVHSDDRARFARRWQDVLRDRTYAEDEVRIRRADGQYRDFNCRSVPIFDARGEVVEWARICVDVTERRREEELRRQKEAAEASNRAKSEFLTKMSHELRTPLNAIIGMSKMLRTRRFGTLNDKQLDYLTDITQAGEHLLYLINDILDLSKVETGRMELKPEPLPVGATIEQVTSTVRALAESKGLELRSEPCQPDGPISADLARFKQILYNLISNAVKFTPQGGRVVVRCGWVVGAEPAAPAAPRDRAGAIRIDVEDNGVGIAPEDQARLGTEFFQARSSPNKAQEGTGLGLALSRRLAEMMGGRLWFVSAPGQGSTFSFALPLAPPSRPGAGEAGAGAPADVAAERALVLIIEDHPPTNKLLADWLADTGLKTASAYDGTTGLDMARRLRPRLILLDVRLPGVSGLDVLHQLKCNPETARLPVVVVSVLEGREDLQALDVLDWFVKPLDREEMLHRLQGALPDLFTLERTVLVVEDDGRVRKWLRDMLLAEGLHVDEAENGAEALAVLKNGRPDLILLDLLMPQLNGFQMVQAIRANRDWERIPIMVITAKDITAEERKRLGDIQAIFRKDTLTRDKLLDRMHKLGLDVAPPPG